MSEERRSFTLDRAGTRTTNGQAGAIRFRGHAAVFGERAWIGDERRGFWEEITKGAFDKALAEDDVRLLLEHDPRWILGRTSAGTLRLSTDKRGLVVDADFPNTSYASDASESLARGDLSQMSFGFNVRDGGEELATLKDGSTLRRLNDITLSDVSIVAYPAYAGTEAALRSVEARRAEHIHECNAERRAWLEAARKEIFE
jgi:HK97 family phage prohead protease